MGWEEKNMDWEVCSYYNMGWEVIIWVGKSIIWIGKSMWAKKSMTWVSKLGWEISNIGR